MSHRARRMALLTAVSALAAGVAPAGAVAATASLTAPTVPVPEDIPTQIAVSGDAGTGLELYVRTRVAGAAPCAPVYKNDTGDTILSRDVTGPFSQLTSVTYYSPGANQICIWLQADSSSNTAAFATTATVNVRQPNTTFSLTPPIGPRSGKQVQLSVTYQAEVERELYVRVKPAGGAGCTPNAKNNTGDYLISGSSLNGGPATLTNTFTAGAPGTYLLCGWVQEDSSDETAEVTTQATFTVPRISTKTGLRVRRYYGTPQGYEVTGKVVGGAGGGSVTLERFTGGQWRKWKSGTVGSYGGYSIVIYPKRKTLIRVRYPGNTTYLPSTSKEQTVKRFR